MRVGMNPQKSEGFISLTSKHRMIMVCYIPDFSDYYQASFEVLQLCVESAIKTFNAHGKITLVNNGSCAAVRAYFNTLFESGQIDSVIHHQENMGKIDAMMHAARGVREEYITFSDTDILFKNGWQDAVELLLDSYPDIGSVSPISVRNTHSYVTVATMRKLLRGKYRFYYESLPQNMEDYNRFLLSINWKPIEDVQVKWPVIDLGAHKVLMGSGHSVVTIRRSIVRDFVPKDPTLILIGKHSVYNYIDLPVDLAGKMRVSTYANWAYHMGNAPDAWMHDIQKDNLAAPQIPYTPPVFQQGKMIDYKTFWYKIQKEVFKKLFFLRYPNP